MPYTFNPFTGKLDYYELSVSGGGDMLAATYDPANGAEQVAFSADVVPYTGATNDIDIGNHTFKATNAFIQDGWNTMMWNFAGVEFYSDSGVTFIGSIVPLSAGIYMFDNGSNIVGNLDFSSLTTSDKTFIFPDASGTIALTSDIVAGSSINIQEIDGTPSITVSTLKVNNGCLTDNGSGVATLLIPIDIDGGSFADTYINTADINGGSF